MPLYTIIANHDDGLYISQPRARTAVSALARWVQDDKSSHVIHKGRRSTKERLEKDLLDPKNRLVPLDGCVCVWCASEIVRGKLLLINIVETRA